MTKSSSPFIFTAVIVLFVLLMPASGIGGEKVPGEEMLGVAKKAVADKDPNAWLVKAKYSKGDRSCRFRSARFDFASPRLREEGLRKSCFRVYVKNGNIDKIRQASSCRRKSVPNPDPQNALSSALETGFGPWWENNQQAWLYMRLFPDSGRYGSRCPGGDYLWKIIGSGPGINEDYILYLNATTLSVCEEKKKQHHMNTKKIQKSLQDVKKILEK